MDLRGTPAARKQNMPNARTCDCADNDGNRKLIQVLHLFAFCYEDLFHDLVAYHESRSEEHSIPARREGASSKDYGVSVPFDNHRCEYKREAPDNCRALRR